jgi:hypothetical protein
MKFQKHIYNYIAILVLYEDFLTFLAMSTSSSEHHHMEAWDHRQKRRLASLISSGPGTQKPLLLMHLLSPQANQSA